MKNEILYQNNLYSVVDISTETFKDVQTIIDNSSIDKIGNHRIYVNTGSNGKLRVIITIKSKGLKLHRFLLDAPPDKEVDHINGNPLVNIISNLRLCEHKENSRNTHKATFKGVYPAGKKWKVSLRYNGSHVYLGVYDTVEEAAKTYNSAARLFFGEFANLNNV